MQLIVIITVWLHACQVFALEAATLYTLCRNSDLYPLLKTIASYEYRFNARYKYDWVFLNDKEFSDEFKDLVSAAVSGNAYFGLIPESEWSIPSQVDQRVMNGNINRVLSDPEGAYPYADSLSYRNMCRFESGFFYHHELFANYDYYWRVEPGVELSCDMDDIFEFMRKGDYDYAFTISTLEYPKTIPGLFDALVDVMNDLGVQNLIDNGGYSDFVNMDGEYTMCHFWTNFEIGNLNTLRGLYDTIFKKLDSHEANGFYYERWGDAPVRSLILSMVLPKKKIVHLDKVGYTHPPYTQCPQDFETRLKLRCSCDPEDDITNKWYSCNRLFRQVNSVHGISG